MKLLVIDDEEDIREVASLTLELKEGWDVAAAGSGAEGLKLARDGAPDAILLDVMMPETDGWRTLHRLKSDPALRSKLPKLEAAVAAGRMSPAVAVEEIADALGL